MNMLHIVQLVPDLTQILYRDCDVFCLEDVFDLLRRETGDVYA